MSGKKGGVPQPEHMIAVTVTCMTVSLIFCCLSVAVRKNLHALIMAMLNGNYAAVGSFMPAKADL